MSVRNYPPRLLVIPEPSTGFHRRLHFSITCSASGKPERLQRPLLPTRPTARKPARLGNVLTSTEQPERIEAFDKTVEADESPVHAQGEEYGSQEKNENQMEFMQEESSDSSSDLVNKVPALARPVMKPRRITMPSSLQKAVSVFQTNDNQTQMQDSQKVESTLSFTQENKTPELIRPSKPTTIITQNQDGLEERVNKENGEVLSEQKSEEETAGMKLRPKPVAPPARPKSTVASFLQKLKLKRSNEIQDVEETETEGPIAPQESSQTLPGETQPLSAKLKRPERSVNNTGLLNLGSSSNQSNSASNKTELKKPVSLEKEQENKEQEEREQEDKEQDDIEQERNEIEGSVVTEKEVSSTETLRPPMPLKKPERPVLRPHVSSTKSLQSAVPLKKPAGPVMRAELVEKPKKPPQKIPALIQPQKTTVQESSASNNTETSLEFSEDLKQDEKNIENETVDSLGEVKEILSSTSSGSNLQGIQEIEELVKEENEVVDYVSTVEKSPAPVPSLQPPKMLNKPVRPSLKPTLRPQPEKPLSPANREEMRSVEPSEDLKKEELENKLVDSVEKKGKEKISTESEKNSGFKKIVDQLSEALEADEQDEENIVEKKDLVYETESKEVEDTLFILNHEQQGKQLIIDEQAVDDTEPETVVTLKDGKQIRVVFVEQEKSQASEDTTEESIIDEDVKESVVDKEFKESVIDEDFKEPVHDEELKTPVLAEEFKEPVLAEEFKEPVVDEEFKEPVLEETTEQSIKNDIVEHPVAYEEIEDSSSSEDEGVKEATERKPSVASPPDRRLRPVSGNLDMNTTSRRSFSPSASMDNLLDADLDEEVESEEWKTSQELIRPTPRIQKPPVKPVNRGSTNPAPPTFQELARAMKTENPGVSPASSARILRPQRVPTPPKTEGMNRELRGALQQNRERRVPSSPVVRPGSPLARPQRKSLSESIDDDEVIESLESPVVEDRATPKLMNKPLKKPPTAREDATELYQEFMKEKDKRKKEAEAEWRQERQERRLKADENKLRRRERKENAVSDVSLIDIRRKARQERQEKRESSKEEAEKETIIEVGAEGMSVSDLAQLLAVDSTEVIKILFLKGVMVTINQTLDMDSVKVVANEMDVVVADKVENEVTDFAKKDVNFVEIDEENSVQRPPVVTVMGHVDHGKTSLLDYIRNSAVASGEAGGITQSIGAYTCSVKTGEEERMVCFLDTPGHEAFSAMRARGAKVTDIVIIIIAADDGIQPQTLEAISHAQAAEVPLIVAINKIDAPGADPEKIKRQLSEIELLPEEWGGQTPVVSISAKTGEGITELLEMITLVADIQLNLQANPECLAKGTVIEAYLDKRSGVVATLLIQNGTLEVGDAVVSGGSFGKVRNLTDEMGAGIGEAGPSFAVQMLGLNILPVAGDIFEVREDESEARELAQKESEKIRKRYLAEASGGGSMVTLSSLASNDDEETQGLQRINIILKADTSGSLEAIRGSLSQLPQDSVMLRYLHAAAGEVTESDVLLAAAADGIVFGFNVPISESVKSIAKQKGVELHGYSVIYHLLDDVRAAMEGTLNPSEEKIPLGQAEVKAVFEAGSSRVAGCKVLEGKLETGCFLRVVRKQNVCFEGFLSSLRRVKDVVEEVSAGLECGVGCDEFSDWSEGDIIEAYALAEKRPTLEESHAAKAIDQDELKDVIGS